MSDESTGAPGGPPTFPGNAPPPPAQQPPPQPPPQAPPSYPGAPGGPGGGYPPPPPPGQYGQSGQYGQYAAPGYGLPQASPYASWGARLGGWLIDAVIFAVINGIIGAAFRHTDAGSVHFTMTTNHVVHHDRFSFVALGLVLVLAIAYSTLLCGGARGQTVGMMAVGARAVRADGHTALGYGPAFGRSVLEVVFRFTVIVWILDMLFPLWDARNQTLHDKAVGSVVIRVRNAG
jgi:uncharacterized RDD family membrane protein YckC